MNRIRARKASYKSHMIHTAVCINNDNKSTSGKDRTSRDKTGGRNKGDRNSRDISHCALPKQESPAVAYKPARRLRKVRTVYVRAVGL